MHEFAPRLRAALAQHRQTLVDTVVARIGAVRETAPLPAFEPADLAQFLHALEAMLAEALTDGGSTSVRENVVTTMLPGIRDTGMSSREATSWTGFYFVQVAGLCLPELPADERGPARDFLAEFVRRYYEDLYLVWGG